jgi:predicted kinase
MSRRTYREVGRLAEDLLRAGWPVVLDGSFSRSTQREEARAIAERVGVPYTVLWCDAPDAVLAARLRDRRREGREVSDGREELLAEHRARYESPEREADVMRLDTSRDADPPV